MAPGLPVSPNVLAVGGTSLYLNSSGNYSSVAGWSGSGGGISAYEKEPSYQKGVQNTGARTTPDVSYNANPSTGYLVYDSVPYQGQSGWWQVGGTSARAPQCARIMALTDQVLRTSPPKGSLGNAQASVYNLPSSDFHDVTTGSNGYSAGKGYDLVMGLGSPSSTSSFPALPPSKRRNPRRIANAERNDFSAPRSSLWFERGKLSGILGAFHAQAHDEDGHEDVLGHHEGQDGRDGPEGTQPEGGEHGDGAGQDLQQPQTQTLQAIVIPTATRGGVGGGASRAIRMTILLGLDSAPRRNPRPDPGTHQP